MSAAPGKFLNKILRENPGFTIVEFLIVFSITSVIIALAIPAFNSFNHVQSLKTTAAELKTNLRQAQNKALSGEKNSSCSTLSNVSLFGWYIRFDTPTSYTIASRCVNNGVDPPVSYGGDSNGDYDAKTYTVRNITGISTTPSDVYILFQPVTKGVAFYHATSPVSFSSIYDTISSVTITLTGIDAGQYTVSVDRSGEIVDVKTP